MNGFDLGNRLHRSIKMALDTGEAKTLDDAERIFGGYRLTLEVGHEVAVSSTLQAAVLTAVNTASRCFLGGVKVTGTLDVPLLVRWRTCSTLEEAVANLGGQVSKLPEPGAPLLVFGQSDRVHMLAGEFAVRVTFDGWVGAVTPLKGGRRLTEAHEFIPSGVLAGALGVAEAFQHVRGGNSMIGRRDVGLSLWRPGEDPWSERAAAIPSVDILPSMLWLIGLGHLGQAFLWTLGLLPYARPEDVLLVLQDFDILAESNLSTSPLTFTRLIGQRKTRAMALWCEERGFRTVICERRFRADFMVSADEPKLALCGVDNALARADLEDVGFERVIEAGLEAGPTEYLAFQVHTFPGPQRARERWGKAEGNLDKPSASNALVQQPGYQALAADGLDACGLVTLANRTVGASFVGAAVSAIVISEVLRSLLGEAPHGLIDGSFRSLSNLTAIVSTSDGGMPNLGYSVAA